jgi:hypothetical protein
VPGIVSGLHPDPNTGSVPEQLAEPHGHGRRYWLPLGQDIIEVLAGDAEQTGDFGLRLTGGRDHVLAQQSAGMDGAALRIALRRVFGHPFTPQ